MRPTEALLLLTLCFFFPTPGHATDQPLPTPYFDAESNRYFVGPVVNLSTKTTEPTDNHRPLEVSLDGQPFQIYSGSVQFEREGKHTLGLRLQPVGQLAEPVQTREVIADLSAPVSYVEIKNCPRIERNHQTFVSPLGTLELTARDDFSGVATIEYSWDNVTFLTYQAPVMLDREGATTFYYRAIDHVGNVEKTNVFRFDVDRTPPTAHLKLMGPSHTVTVNDKTYQVVSDGSAVNLEAQDKQSGVKAIWFSTDQSPYVAFSKPIFFLKDGPHHLSFYAEDQVGNKETAQQVDLYTQSTPSKTEARLTGSTLVSDGQRYAATGTQVVLETHPSVAGIERVEVKVDQDKEFRRYLQPISFATAGKHQVFFRSLDRAGNLEPLQTFSFYLVSSAPETRIETQQPLLFRQGEWFSPIPNAIILKTSRTAVGLKEILVSVNEKPFEAYRAPIAVSPEKEVFKVSFKSVDRLGNEEMVKTVSYRLLPENKTRPLYALPAANEEKAREEYFQASPLLIPVPSLH